MPNDTAFKISPETKVGRDWHTSMMKVHNEMVSNPKSQVDCRQSKFSKQYSKWLKSEKRWQPTWEQRTMKKSSDKVHRTALKKIKNSKGGAGTTDCHASPDHEKFKKWRARNPTYVPGWSEALTIKAQLEKHEKVVKAAGCRVDTHLDVSHALFKKWRAENPPLPPIDEPTPKQYYASKHGISRSPSRAQSVADGASVKSSARGRRLRTAEWDSGSETQHFGEEPAKHQKVVDEKLVRYVFQMSLGNSSNDNVAKLVKQHTAEKFPDLYRRMGVPST